MTMTLTRFGDHACQKWRAMLDSYIDNELLLESTIELMEHFKRCAECARESQQRRNVRARLRDSVRTMPLAAGLRDRVRDRIRQLRGPRSKKFYLFSIAATLAVGSGSWVASHFGAFGQTRASRELCVAAISRVRKHREDGPLRTPAPPPVIDRPT